MAELGVLLMGGACAIFAVAAIPTLIELRKVIAEARETLLLVNHELLPLLKEIRTVSEHVNALADQAQTGMDQASSLFEAIGTLGQTLQRLQHVLERQGGFMITRATILGAGLRAAANALRERMQRQRSTTNGR